MFDEQKAIKWIKFGDRQNEINDVISTGVLDVPNVEDLHNVPSPDTSQKISIMTL